MKQPNCYTLLREIILDLLNFESRKWAKMLSALLRFLVVWNVLKVACDIDTMNNRVRFFVYLLPQTRRDIDGLEIPDLLTSEQL